MAYLTANNINATKDESGLYYQIITPGGDEKPTLESGPYITYLGTLMSTGEEFDKRTEPYYFENLKNLIQGWQIGVPKIGRGGAHKIICTLRPWL